MSKRLRRSRAASRVKTVEGQKVPVDELLLAAREAAQERAPQLELLPSLRGRRDSRRGVLPAGVVAEHADTRAAVQVFGEVAGVAGADGQLVGIDDGERVELEAVEREAHAVERELMQPAPRHRPRRRVHDHAVALERKAVVEQRGIAAAIVEDDRGVRVVVAKVAHQIDDALWAFVDETGVDVAGRRDGRGRRGGRPGGDRRRVLGRAVERPILAEQTPYAVGLEGAPAASPRLFGADVRPVDDADVETLVGHHADAFGRGGPDETGVLANINVVERVALPELARVAERAAGDPGPALRGVDVAPGVRAHQIVKEQVVRAAHVGAAAGERLDLPAKPVRRIPVVVVPVRDESAARPLAGKVAFGADGEPSSETVVADALVGRKQVIDGPFAVVYDDELLSARSPAAGNNGRRAGRTRAGSRSA